MLLCCLQSYQVARLHTSNRMRQRGEREVFSRDRQQETKRTLQVAMLSNIGFMKHEIWCAPNICIQVRGANRFGTLRYGMVWWCHGSVRGFMWIFSPSLILVCIYTRHWFTSILSFYLFYSTITDECMVRFRSAYRSVDRVPYGSIRTHVPLHP